jgi:hypothetical protein
MKKETEMTEFDIDSIVLEDITVYDLLDILKTHGKDTFEEVFTQWFDSDPEPGNLYDLVMSLVNPNYL